MTMITIRNVQWTVKVVAFVLTLRQSQTACNAFSSTSSSSSAPMQPPQSPSLATQLQIFYDSSNRLHRDIKYHPECPDRIDHCLDALRGYFSSETMHGPHMLIDVATDTTALSNNEHHHEYWSPLTEEELEHAQKILSKIHEPSFITSLQKKCDASRQRRIDEGKDPVGWIGYIDGSDTYLTTESYDVGVRAAGAWIRAVDGALGPHENSAISSNNANAKTTTSDVVGMALTRPPGHHATHSEPNGFCIFNFAMAAAAHALAMNPSIKISILDWDVHFGQGLMDILGKCSSSIGDDEHNDWTKNVRYVSLHQVPCFPYEGQSRKVQGKHGNVMTIPIQPESTWHCGYRELFTTHALPFLCSSRDDNDWEPDLIIICAGYDALDSDDLASVNLVAKDYGEMTRLLQEHVGHSSKQPAIVLGLEGGYQLRDGVAGGNLSDALIETIKALQS